MKEQLLSELKIKVQDHVSQKNTVLKLMKPSKSVHSKEIKLETHLK